MIKTGKSGWENHFFSILNPYKFTGYMNEKIYSGPVCGIALIDSDGNVVYGKTPSVNECQSYDAPSLLEMQYVWRF